MNSGSILRPMRSAECGVRNQDSSCGHSAFRIPHSALQVFYTYESTILHLTTAPVKKAKLLPPGIDDERGLPGLGKEIALDEQVVARQEYTHPRMRVLPADDFFAHKVGFDLAPQGRPTFV